MALIFVTKEGCGLCEKAERALWSLGLPYLRREVDKDPGLFPYALRVPVLLWQGRVLLEGGFDEKALLELARRLREGEWTQS